MSAKQLKKVNINLICLVVYQPFTLYVSLHREECSSDQMAWSEISYFEFSAVICWQISVLDMVRQI